MEKNICLPLDGELSFFQFSAHSIVGAAGGVARFPKGFREVLMLVLTFYVMIVLSNSDRSLAINLSLEVSVI